MTAPMQSDDPLAGLFLPPTQGPAVALRWRSGLLTAWDVATGENTISIDGVSFSNLPILPGSYLGILKAGDVVSLLSTTDSRGIATYALAGIAITPPDTRMGQAAAQPGMSSEVQATSGNVVSTTYTDVLSAGFTPQVVFRASTTKAIITVSSYLVCGTSLGFAYMSFQLREGAVKGAGNIVLDADDSRALMNRDNSAGGGDIQASFVHPVEILTPGAFYNVQGMYRTSTGTSTFLNRSLIADPK